MEKKYLVVITDEWGNVTRESSKLSRDEMNLIVNAWLDNLEEDYSIIIQETE